ncbi:MAG: hypothetical protein AB1505_00285 [Candidatus Latescibacterota bacterium]
MLVLAAVLPGPAAVATAQVLVQLNAYASYTDNLFQNYTRRPDWVTLAYVDLGYRHATGLDLYYSGHASLFAEYRELFSHGHQLGVDYTWSGLEGSQVYAGARGQVRLDRSAYRYRDYLQGNAYLQAKVYLRPLLLTRAGYEVRYREYPHAQEYSFAEQLVSAQLSRSLPTRTTLQLHGEVGVKTFARSDGGARHLAQAALRAKVAQSLTERTGLQLEYLRRASLTGRGRYARTEIYDPDDELFDDRYTYSADEVRATLKHLAWGLQAQASGHYGKRRYEDRPALDLDGFLIGPDTMRRDTRRGLALEAERTFRPSGPRAPEVRLQAEWLYTDVDSNDPYYQTVSQVYSAGVQIGF